MKGPRKIWCNIILIDPQMHIHTCICSCPNACPCISSGGIPNNIIMIKDTSLCCRNAGSAPQAFHSLQNKRHTSKLHSALATSQPKHWLCDDFISQLFYVYVNTHFIRFTVKGKCKHKHTNRPPSPWNINTSFSIRSNWLLQR